MMKNFSTQLATLILFLVLSFSLSPPTLSFLLTVDTKDTTADTTTNITPEFNTTNFNERYPFNEVKEKMALVEDMLTKFRDSINCSNSHQMIDALYLVMNKIPTTVEAVPVDASIFFKESKDPYHNVAFKGAIKELQVVKREIIENENDLTRNILKALIRDYELYCGVTVSDEVHMQMKAEKDLLKSEEKRKKNEKKDK